MSFFNPDRSINIAAVRQHDFQHSPLGPLERAIGVTQAQGVRASRTQALAHRVKKLGGRMMSVTEPAEVRAEQAFRRGLKQVSKSVGHLLGALTDRPHHARDDKQTVKALHALNDALTAICPTRESAQAVFSARLAHNLGELEGIELLNLARGLAELPPDSREALDAMTGPSTLAHAIGEELASVLAEPENARKLYNDLWRETAAEISTGPNQPPRTAVVREKLLDKLQQGLVDRELMGDGHAILLLNALDTADLEQLAAGGERVDGTRLCSRFFEPNIFVERAGDLLRRRQPTPSRA